MWRSNDEGDCKRNVAVCQVPFCAKKKSIAGSWFKIQGYLKAGMHYGLGIENLMGNHRARGKRTEMVLRQT